MGAEGGFETLVRGGLAGMIGSEEDWAMYYGRMGDEDEMEVEREESEHTSAVSSSIWCAMVVWLC